MGITRLMNLLREKCPEAIKQLDLKAYTGRIVACDASMVIQFSNNSVHISIFNLYSTYKIWFRTKRAKRL